MCFYYPTSKPKNKKAKKPTSTKRSTSRESTQEFAYTTADQALRQGFPKVGATAMNSPYGMYTPYGAPQRFEDYEPGYITRAQWASHGETLKGTFGAARENGNKLDEMKAFMSNGMTETRDAAKSTQSALVGNHLAIKDTFAAVGDVHKTLKETYDAINKNHGEHVSKQDGCAAEIRQVRTLLEDEAKKREEAQRKQQQMQEAWTYFQSFQQAERNAEPNPSRSSTRTHSSRSSSSSSSNTSRRRASAEDQHESERRKRRERERAFWEYMEKGFSDAYPHADRPEGPRGNHDHFSPYSPASPAWAGQYRADSWGGWRHAPPPYPGWGGFYDDNIDDDMGQRRAPPGRPYNAPRGGRAPRSPWGYM
ncbi:hypothetical protein F4804DRAFT_351423 [Jackrogersella minutella]|nr:hypothetical protein F4804DRAFT_351423 [Jackrogersella minutella]